MSSYTANNHYEWDVENFYKKNSFAILFLNQPIGEDIEKFLKENWNRAVVRVAVDGGANHLKSIFGDSMLVPEIISGDFDSAESGTIEFFKEKGSNIIHTPDQDETDFTKAVTLLSKYITEHDFKVSSIIAISGSGGRLDHMFANLNSLYRFGPWLSIPIFILGEMSLTWFLSQGTHVIQVPFNMKDSNIGLIPLGKECTDITTTGLKWNLKHGTMKFGGLVSTSNRFDDSANEVHITTNTELIWTMEYKLSL